MTVILRDIGSILQLNQSANCNPRGLSVGNIIAISQTVGVSPKIITAVSKFVITQSIAIRTSILNLSVSHIFTISQAAYKTIPLSAISWFFPYHAARTVGYNAILQALLFNQMAVVQRIRPARSVLLFTQSLGLVKTITYVASNSLIMQSRATCYKLDSNFVAINIVMPTPPGGDNGHCS